MNNTNQITDTKALAVLPVAVQTRAAAVSMEEAERMLPAVQAIWPKDVAANPVLQRMVARVAIAYGLDPLMGEITIYQGKPYITIDGRMRKAQEQPTYQGLEARPATEEERRNYRAREDDHLWYCEAFRSDWPRPARGWGLVRKGDKNFVAQQTPELIAEKRAKARSLRDLFQIPLPSAEDEDGLIQAPPAWVNPETGEVLDTRPSGMLAARGQIAAIHALGEELGIDEDARHEQLRTMFGKARSNELTEGEAAAYLEYLGGLEAEREAKREANRPELLEAKIRDAAPLQVPRPASKRFHIRTDATEEDISVEDPPVDPAPEPEAEPTGAAEDPTEGDGGQTEYSGLLSDMPDRIRTPLVAAASGILQTPMPDWSEAYTTKQVAGLGRALLAKGFAALDVDALLSLLHLAMTGESVAAGNALETADGRHVVYLANDKTVWPLLLEAAQWKRLNEEE